MKDSRSLIRYSVRSSDSEWLACRISDPEHQHMVVGRAAALRAVRARHGPLELGPERLEVHQRVHPLEVVALRRQLPQPRVHVKQPRLPRHDPPRRRSRPSESSTGRGAHGFLEGRLRPRDLTPAGWGGVTCAPRGQFLPNTNRILYLSPSHACDTAPSDESAAGAAGICSRMRVSGGRRISRRAVTRCASLSSSCSGGRCAHQSPRSGRSPGSEGTAGAWEHRPGVGAAS